MPDPAHRITRNFSTHKEDDVDMVKTALTHRLFNSHPHKEDDVSNEVGQTPQSFFNSHPHKEDDFY